MRLVAALLASLLLAGCTAQVDSAKQQLETVKDNLQQAQDALAAAKKEAGEAKDRLDRVRSLAVLREERVALALAPNYADGTLTFRLVNATRSNGEEIPAENLTQLPPLLLTVANATFACDPLTCMVVVDEGATVQATFADAPETSWEIVAGAPEQPTLALADARVLATTSVGDATD